LYSDISDIQNLKKISDESMKEFTDDFELYTTIASACKKNSLLNETVFAYKKAIGLNNKSTRIYQYLGEVYLELGDSKNAINSFKECISIDSDNELYNWLLSKAYLLDSQIDKAKEQINIAIKSYSGDKNYFIQYAEICGELYKDTYPELEKLMINYIDETKLYNGRSEEIKNKIFEFLEKCDSGSNNEIILFELWEYFNDSDILYFLKEGSDNVKYHLRKNKSLTSEQLNLLSNNLNESVFRLMFNFENIDSNIKANNGEPIESKDDLIWILEEILDRVISTIEAVEYYEEDTRFEDYDDIDDLINAVKEKFEDLKEIIEFKNDPLEIEDTGTNCDFLPCFPGDEYSINIIFRNIDFGKLGCRYIFESPTSDIENRGLALSMEVEVWSNSEGKGYEFSEGKLDDEFVDNGGLRYWKLDGNITPTDLVF
jgi:tetratricopeptide (TPR) repeat protein